MRKSGRFPARSLILGCALAVSGAGEIIDRVAAVVGRRVITLSDARREARLEAYCNGLPPASVAGANNGHRPVLERLIQQALIRQEMDQTSFPSVDDAQAGEWVLKLKPGGDPAAYGLSRRDLLDYARRQLDVLRFVDLRFKTGLQIQSQQVESYYEKTLVPELKRRGISPPPPLDQTRAQIERILVEERANELLDAWLGEQRARIPVRIQEAEKS